MSPVGDEYVQNEHSTTVGRPLDTDRNGTDAEGADVCEGRDCDGAARFPHCLPDPLRQGESGFLLVAQVVQALHDHEHVVNSDSCNNKRAMAL